MGVREAGVEWVHEIGIAAEDDLAEVLKAEGYRPRPSTLGRLHQEYEDVVKVGQLYVSLDSQSEIAISLRVMADHGIDDPNDLMGGVRRTIGPGHLVASVGRSEAAEVALGVLSPLRSSWPPPDRFDLAEDKRLRQLLLDQPGGVLQRKALDIAIARSDIDAKAVSITYSPLIEMVAAGVFGARAAPIDLASVERLRTKKMGPWALWGRLDRARTWVQAKARGAEIRARVPFDCRDFIGTEAWPLIGATGASLGQIHLNGETVNVQWDDRPPIDWDGAQHGVVFEFDRERNVSRLLAGYGPGGPEDRRLVDGLFLHRGRWRAVLSTDDRSAEGWWHVPLGVDGLEEIEVGVESRVDSAHGAIRIIREPHVLRLKPLEPVPLVAGSSLAVGFQGGRAEVKPGRAPTSEIERLLFAAGLYERPPSPFRAIGAAMGLSDTDRADVVRGLADRERFDLAALAATVSVSPTGPSTVRPEVPVETFSMIDGRLAMLDGPNTLYAVSSGGSGPFGFVWRHEPGGELSAAWSMMSLALLWAWAAAATHDVIVERRGSLWANSDEIEADDLPTILGILGDECGQLAPEALEFQSGVLAVNDLGYRIAVSEAEKRLRRLIIRRDAWVGFDIEGVAYGPGPLDAIRLRPGATTPEEARRTP